jgi:hypothetical protein
VRSPSVYVPIRNASVVCDMPLHDSGCAFFPTSTASRFPSMA